MLSALPITHITAVPWNWSCISWALYFCFSDDVLCCFNQESTSSKKAKTDGREGEEAVKSEVEDDDEQDGNEVRKTHAS